MEFWPTPHYRLNILQRSNVYSNMHPCVAALENAAHGGLVSRPPSLLIGNRAWTTLKSMVAATTIRISKIAWITYLGALSRLIAILLLKYQPPSWPNWCKVHRLWALFREGMVYKYYHVEKKLSLGFLWHFQDIYCVEFVENVSFKSLGDICWPLLPSSILTEFLMDKRDSDWFSLRRVVCIGLAIVP